MSCARPYPVVHVASVIPMPSCHHDPTTPASHQVGDERAALGLVAAQGERLLELVDREQHATVAVGLRGGVREHRHPTAKLNYPVVHSD